MAEPEAVVSDGAAATAAAVLDGEASCVPQTAVDAGGQAGGSDATEDLVTTTASLADETALARGAAAAARIAPGVTPGLPRQSLRGGRRGQRHETIAEGAVGGRGYPATSSSFQSTGRLSLGPNASPSLRWSPVGGLSAAPDLAAGGTSTRPGATGPAQGCGNRVDVGETGLAYC